MSDKRLTLPGFDRNDEFDEIEDLEEFIQNALGFDYYYQMSDDHRVYLAGRRAEDRILDYASKHKIAQQIWDFICDHRGEMHMVSQLIRRVEKVVFADDDVDATDKLRDFCLDYLATTESLPGRGTMIGKSIREAIAREAEVPNFWAWKEPAKYKDHIDDWIARYKEAKNIGKSISEAIAKASKDGSF